MAFALNAGVRLHWRIDGAADKPVLVLLNSIGTDIALYDAAVPHLLSDVRVLRIDSRGHGASDAPDGDYSLDLLAGDVLSVMDAAGVETAAVCGTSLGGMVAMTLALKAPARSDWSYLLRAWNCALPAVSIRALVPIDVMALVDETFDVVEPLALASEALLASAVGA